MISALEQQHQVGNGRHAGSIGKTAGICAVKSGEPSSALVWWGGRAAVVVAGALPKSGGLNVATEKWVRYCACLSVTFQSCLNGLSTELHEFLLNKKIPSGMEED